MRRSQALTAHAAHIVEGLLIQGLRLKGVASDKLGFDGVADKFTDGLAAHLMVSDADAGNSNIGLDLHNGEAMVSTWRVESAKLPFTRVSHRVTLMSVIFTLFISICS